MNPGCRQMMPVPWASEDPGETWIWGEYLMTFQKNPPPVKPEAGDRILHYAMAVFPVGSFRRPILAVTVERFPPEVMELFAENEGLDEYVPLIGKDTTLSMLCLWTTEGHDNFGAFDPASGPEEIRRRFFGILREHLGLSGEAKLIGTLREAFGHPETGLPPPADSREGWLFRPLEPVTDTEKLAIMPAPWTGADEGETWVWGDFFMTFQTAPSTIYSHFLQSEGRKDDGAEADMTFLFAMTVFWRLDINPHGPTSYPILSVALWDPDSGGHGPKIFWPEDENASGPRPLLVWLFDSCPQPELRSYYKVDRDAGNVKRLFFKIIGKELGVSGQPKKIGTMTEAFGHPETGLSLRKRH
ncbi:MAG: hypothetical protein LBW85_07185 [Deltaproteobacteria bacterium]|nr:hypothetical protein [Deltaproteobacteria bacterium]